VPGEECPCNFLVALPEGVCVPVDPLPEECAERDPEQCLADGRCQLVVEDDCDGGGFWDPEEDPNGARMPERPCQQVERCVPAEELRDCAELPPERCMDNPDCELVAEEFCGNGWCEVVEVCVDRQPFECFELAPNDCLNMPGCHLEEVEMCWDCPPCEPCVPGEVCPPCDCEPGCEREQVCVPDEDPDPCANIRCAEGFRCERGQCVPVDDDCAAVMCGPGEVCVQGECLPAAEAVSVTYMMTQCADPWDEFCWEIGLGGEECLLAFFAELGIPVIELQIERDPDGGDACQACQCSSGEILTVTTTPEGAERLWELLGLGGMGS